MRLYLCSCCRCFSSAGAREGDEQGVDPGASRLLDLTSPPTRTAASISPEAEAGLGRLRPPLWLCQRDHQNGEAHGHRVFGKAPGAARRRTRIPAARATPEERAGDRTRDAGQSAMLRRGASAGQGPASDRTDDEPEREGRRNAAVRRERHLIPGHLSRGGRRGKRPDAWPGGDEVTARPALRGGLRQRGTGRHAAHSSHEPNTKRGCVSLHVRRPSMSYSDLRAKRRRRWVFRACHAGPWPPRKARCKYALPADLRTAAFRPTSSSSMNIRAGKGGRSIRFYR